MKIIFLSNHSKYLLIFYIYVAFFLDQHLSLLLYAYYLTYQVYLHVTALLQSQNSFYLLQLVTLLILLVTYRFPLSSTTQHALRSAMSQFWRFIYKWILLSMMWKQSFSISSCNWVVIFNWSHCLLKISFQPLNSL
mgnify:CR=1 FL=1